MSSTVTLPSGHVPAGDQLPRLLAGLDASGAPIGLDTHLAIWGAVDWRRIPPGFIDELEAAGVAGHGGAWFPVATKWRSVRGRMLKSPVVVANASEGEPGSSKDGFLLTRVPHLALDGAQVAAGALGAGRIVVYASPRLHGALAAAIAERRRRGLDPVEIEVAEAPHAFLAGQETSVVNALNGRPALPSFAGVTPIRVRGVGGRPTLVQNVETLAHVALVARYGSRWYRGLGTPEAPGSMLLTVHGLAEGPMLLEAPLGARLGDVLRIPPDDARRLGGVLLGGYGGGWVPPEAALRLPLTEAAARAQGTSLGAGIVVLLPGGSCPVAETARIVRYLDEQKAEQCGPCVNGLGELAALWTALAVRPGTLGGRVDALVDLCDLVEGRGACRHPDGAARLTRSAFRAFGAHVDAHLGGGPCASAGAPTRLPGLGRIDIGGPGRGRR